MKNEGDSGKKFCVYISKEILPLWYKMQNVAEQLNIPVAECLLNPDYRKDIFVDNAIKKLKQEINKFLKYNEIRNMLVDCHIAQKTYNGISKLKNLNMPKSYVLDYINKELELLELLNMPNKAKSVMKKEILFYKQQYKKTVKE